MHHAQMVFLLFFASIIGLKIYKFWSLQKRMAEATQIKMATGYPRIANNQKRKTRKLFPAFVQHF
jgi:hypothetical protein